MSSLNHPLLVLRTMTPGKLKFSPIGSTLRSFSLGSGTCLSGNDPFGFDQFNNTQSLKFRTPTNPSSQPNAPTIQNAKTNTPTGLSSPLLGGEISRRIAENRQNQLQDLKRYDDRMKIDREEKASLDQLWKHASQLKIQSHFGPLTPASSRVVRTVRIPPTSFLNRAVLASDVERSYRRLSSWLNAAGLRKEIYLNKRYEKPYLKRRRLNSERHRRRFAIEVQRRVQIINVMRMKGM